MNALARIGIFAAGLALVFVAALALGSSVGPDLSAAAEPAGHGEHVPAAQELPGGLMSSQDGYGFRLLDETAEPGRRTVSFVIDGPDGRPVTAYDLEHEKELHLIAVRRDFSGFQHVHPTRGADGTWTTALDLVPGTWRLFADFNPDGSDAMTLGHDLQVPGAAVVSQRMHDQRDAAMDGYRVTLEGDLVAGEHAMLTLRVTKGGRSVTDLEPYLGAYGHLVALRGGDLAYLHVHPEEGEPGPEIEFGAEVPSAGTYHLYLDFKHGGRVRTARFQVTASR